MKIISIVNQKGGVGKSTTAYAVGFGLAHKDKKVLLIDIDPQCNLSFSANADLERNNILDALKGTCDITSTIQHLEILDIIVANPFLNTADNYFTQTGKEYKLKELLEPVKENYDYIVIDTPPSMGVLTTNALTTSDSVIIPCQADIYSLIGIHQLAENLEAIKKYCNPSLTVDGILLTRYNERTLLARDIKGDFEEAAQQMNSKVFKTTIREGIAVKSSQAYNQDLYIYAPQAKVTRDYILFVDELLKGE